MLAAISSAPFLDSIFASPPASLDWPPIPAACPEIY
jgi:hypothetical protein